MPCYHPLEAFRSINQKTDNGKSVIHFNKKFVQRTAYERIKVPCGQCIGCRIERSKEWAIRCVHEASLFTHNCFITLTYEDDCLPPDGRECKKCEVYKKYGECHKGSLCKRDFQLFMKKLRRKYKGKEKINGERKIRFFHCGEYGDKYERPHHHACIFNFDFEDRVLWDTRNTVRIYNSQELDTLWGYGMCTIGDVTVQSAAYVARYVTKKINGDQAAEHYLRIDEETGEMYYIEPEYITMSRRPGIGKDWFDKYKSDVYPKDFVTHNGKPYKTPRYYDSMYDVTDEDEMKRIKRKRKEKSCQKPDEQTQERLKVKKKCLESKLKQCIRKLENGS